MVLAHLVWHLECIASLYGRSVQSPCSTEMGTFRYGCGTLTLACRCIASLSWAVRAKFLQYWDGALLYGSSTLSLAF